MRKISAIILSLILIMSTLAVLAIPASAEDAKVEIGKVAADYKPAEGAIAVNTAEEFAAMAADGNYYLAADIAIDATYSPKNEESKVVPFTGTFDGCGHTITVSVPLFEQFGKTIKNLTIKGAVSADSGNLGALAITIVSGPVTISNIANEATVTHNGAAKTDACVGGLIGRINNATDSNENSVTIENCINKADVKGPEATGGLVGEAQRAPVEGATGIVIKNCINKNKIESISTDSGTASGGIIGYNGNGYITITGCVNNGEVYSNKAAGGIEGDARKGAHVTDCINNGNVTAPGGHAGGMVGLGAYDTDAVPGAFQVANCINYGKIDAWSDAGVKNQKGDAGSVAGYVGRKSAKDNVYSVKNCINYGEIKSSWRVGGMVGYVYAGDNRWLELENCANFGKIITGGFGSQFVGYTNSVKTKIANSIGAGEFEGVEVKDDAGAVTNDITPTHVIVGVSSADVTQMNIENIVLLKGHGMQWASYTTNDKEAARVTFENALKANTETLTKIVEKEADYVSSGALAADYNEKVGKKVLYQEVGKDSLPTITPVVKIDKDGKEVIVNDVIKGADGKVSNPTYVPGGSTPTPTPTPTATGDSTVIMIVVFALAAAAGLALVFVPKKKEN